MDQAQAKPSKLVEFFKAVAALGLLYCFGSVVLGLFYGAAGFWGRGRHADFVGEPMWRYLNLDEPHGGVLGWDRSIWLIGVGYIACRLAMAIHDRLSTTPDERAAKRAQAKREAETEASEQRHRVKAKALERSRKKANRPSMSGWRRLWIVLSILLGVPAFLIAYQDGSRGYAYIDASQETRSLKGQQFWNQLFEQAKHDRTELRSCIPATVRMDHSYEWSYSITCDRRDAFFPALLWALLPATLMWFIGKTIRWIYRGFRPLPTRGEAVVETDNQ